MRSITFDPDDAALVCCHDVGRTLLGMTTGDPAEARRRADAVVQGRMDAHQRRRARDLVDAQEEARARSLPPGFEALLAHMGVDPLGLHALSLATRPRYAGVVGDDPDEPGRCERRANLGLVSEDMSWIRLGHRRALTTWRAECVLTPRLPHTVSTALLGRPLRDLLSHPVLDAFDVRIVAIRPQEDVEEMVEVTTTLHLEGH